MRVTELGIITDSRLEQFLKEYESIVSTPLGITTDFREEHPSKSAPPIFFRLSGNSIFFKLMQSVKVPAPE
jgi:hypothetical protein